MKEGVAYSISSYSRLVAALSCSFFLLLLVLLLSTMADKDALKVGSKVWVKDKDLYGTVRSVKSAKIRNTPYIDMLFVCIKVYGDN